MCFGGRKEDEAGAAKSRELDKIIRADEKRLEREVKLLLLGTHIVFPVSYFLSVNHTSQSASDPGVMLPSAICPLGTNS